MAIVTIVLVPSINHNKNYHKSTIDLSNYQSTSCNCHLYIESYLVSSNFMATDINALYLTDSLSFRIYEGTYDEGDGGISTTCKGDSILVEKYNHETLGINSGKLKTVEKKSYSLKDLKISCISD
jgi:hypothetical protein